MKEATRCKLVPIMEQMQNKRKEGISHQRKKKRDCLAGIEMAIHYWKKKGGRRKLLHVEGMLSLSRPDPLSTLSGQPTSNTRVVGACSYQSLGP